MRRIFTLTFAILLSVIPAYAQVTTGSIAGTVTAADGTALPGVTIEAVHVPTGTRYFAVTGDAGRYVIPNIRVGGPYRVSATLEGFRATERTNLNVALATTAEVDFVLQLAAVTETIVVSANADPIINPGKTGSTSQVSEEQIESLPTVNRSLQDFARTNPYFNVAAWDETATRMTVAGRHERYNNIQIDGAVNNDLFGLSETGTPGGVAGTQPISLDAIEQIQLVISPYDVRQSGFTGGGINAVTRSGSNELQGSVFYANRDPDFVGEGPFDRPIREFSQDQYGGRVGGPIMRDRLFFFFSGEVNERAEPTGVSADASTGTVYRGETEPTSTTPSASRVRNFLMERFNYDPGTLGDISGETNSNLFFGRFDWNLNNNHSLTLRHNYVDAVRDNISDRGTSTFRFPTAIYTIADETNSTVAQLNSVFSANAFNEARVSFQTIRDKRTTPVIFPAVEIGGTGPRRGAINVGTERFSGANELDQDILEITDDFTLIAGNHNITIGTHNEIFEFANLFLSEFYGYYYFPTIEAFEAGTANEYRIGFATGDNPRRPAAFDVSQYGLYVTDQWHVNDRLTLTLGLRGDMPVYGDTPSFNPTVQTALGINTNQTPREDVVVSPRFGFNWSPTGRGEQQLRGGIGIFAGRTPYVWVSNIFANTGVESRLLSCIRPSCTPPAFNPDALAQPRNVGAGGTLSVDLVDPDFEFPRVLRATLGYDRNLFWEIRGTVEGVWSQTQKDIFYVNANRVQTGTSPLDGRPTYGLTSSQLFDAPMLTNTEEGQEILASVQLNRPFTNGLTLSAAYAYMDTESAFDTTSSRAISSFQFNPNPGDIFTEHIARSYWEVRDKVNVAASYNFATGPLAHTIGLFYNAQAGRPYSLLMGGDPNTDRYSTNDLLFVPAGGLILCPSTASGRNAAGPCGGTAANPVAPIDAQRFRDFLASAGIDPAAGRIVDRNELEEPWTQQVDFHYALGLSLFGVRPEITVDVLNLMNLIDSEYGRAESVVFQTYTPIRYFGQDTATGLPIYREEFPGALDPGRQFSTADLRSRWQARLGVRVNF